MAYSDDEEELVPQSVTNFHFVDENEEPISWLLPFQFDDSEEPDVPEEQIFLRGDTDGGLQKVYKQVTAWKLELGGNQPEILVISKDKKWIKLLKPRKSYEERIRTILITVQLLHFLRRKPDSSEKNVWDHLCKVFSSYEHRPSVGDLKNHYPLMKRLTEKDEALAKSQLLLMLLKKKPTKKIFGEDLQSNLDAKKPFIVDDVDEPMVDDDGDESDEEPDLFDSVCAICDNGGELLCCEGSCMRCFHATTEAGEDSDCKSLGFSKGEVEAIQKYWCKNCRYKQHQCFACGKLGSSDKSAGAEVFRCVNGTCGHFYHPKCVADLLFENEKEAAEYQKKVAAGESFACPIHKCIVCKKGENKEVEELHFAMCRRCPRSYHRKCLPRKIAFEDIEEEGIIQRAWEDLLPSRILIYCLKHKIDEELGTPIRNHIIFPEDPSKKKAMDGQKNRLKVLTKKNKQDSDDLLTTIKPVKAGKKTDSLNESRSMVRSGKTAEQELGFKKKINFLKDSSLSVSREVDLSIPLESRRSPKEKKKVVARTAAPPSLGNVFISSFPRVDGELEKRMIAFREKSSSSITLEGVLKKRTMPSTHAYSARHIDKSITHGKVEGFVEAIKTALQKVESGGSVEDAKAFCEPNILKQLLKWNNKLKVYLAPFLHGMRYTSFGRHFTKVDKLKEIVDKLQWYVQNGDTIVDFCCGANDFSCLMKEKLDAVGKKCYFKNFDLIQPKNDFNFKKQDWMTVQPKDLPIGSQLIMGLNPPFGVNAALANKFIDKALTFRPKLIILIVPKETERLDKKKPPYDLIWEDCEKLSGKSFYLPGSVDINDKQMDQWNNNPPPLYLWSHRDWTANHKAIASKLGHTSKGYQEPPRKAKFQLERMADAFPAEVRLEERSGEKYMTRREGNNKNPEQSSKRSLPTSAKSSSPKRRKLEREQKQLSEQKKEDELPNMSISPPDTRGLGELSKDHLTVRTFETPAERGSSLLYASGYGAVSGGGRTDASHDEEIDNIAKRYSMPSNRDGLFNNASHNWSNVAIDSGDYGVRSSEERFSAYGNADTFERNSYLHMYGRSSYADTKMQQDRPYTMQEQEDPVQRSRFSLGSSAVGSSAMQRYAPQLEETNFARGAGNLEPGAPLPGIRRHF